MVEFTHILCATDLHERSRRPLAHAVSLAQWYKAQLTALHAVPTFEPLAVRPARLDGPVRVVHPASREEVLAEVHRAVQEVGGGWMGVNLVAEAGDPAQAITAHALKNAIDLVVLGTHGRAGFEQFILGSVAEKVLRRAPCPVLTVPPRAAATVPPEVRFKNILCAMDFSPSARRAVTFAQDLAHRSDGVLTILNVIDWRPEDESGVYQRLNPPKYGQQLVTDARARLQALISGESPSKSAIRSLVLPGRPSREILRAAAAAPCDLIVMGTQGRSGLDLALIGSTTQHVVRRATCPVLTVRLPARGRGAGPTELTA